MFCYCKVIKSQCPLMSDKKKDNYPFTGIIIVKIYIYIYHVYNSITLVKATVILYVLGFYLVLIHS